MAPKLSLPDDVVRLIVGYAVGGNHLSWYNDDGTTWKTLRAVSHASRAAADEAYFADVGLAVFGYPDISLRLQSALSAMLALRPGLGGLVRQLRASAGQVIDLGAGAALISSLRDLSMTANVNPFEPASYDRLLASQTALDRLRLNFDQTSCTTDELLSLINHVASTLRRLAVNGVVRGQAAQSTSLLALRWLELRNACGVLLQPIIDAAPSLATLDVDDRALASSALARNVGAQLETLVLPGPATSAVDLRAFVGIKRLVALRGSVWLPLARTAGLHLDLEELIGHLDSAQALEFIEACPRMRYVEAWTYEPTHERWRPLQELKSRLTFATADIGDSAFGGRSKPRWLLQRARPTSRLAG